MKTISVKEEFERNLELRREDLEYLKEWIKQEKYLPQIPEIWLIFFLHGCGYSLEMSKSAIKNYYIYRTQHNYFFRNRSPKLDPNLADAIDSTLISVLPKRTEGNHMVILVRLMNNDVDLWHFEAFLKLYFILFDLFLVQGGTSEGLVVIHDCEPFTLPMLGKLSMTTLRKVVFYFEDAIPIKLHQVHFINSSAVIDTFFRLLKQYINPRVLDSIHFHKTGSESLFSHVAKEIIPERFGGTEVTSLEDLHDNSKRLIQLCEPWLKEDENVRCNLSLCPEASTREESDSIFGVSGSFKKLSID